MGLEQLSEKLDHITNEDLGVPFDEGMIWDKLENKMSARRTSIYPWLVAAALALFLLSFPIVVLEKTMADPQLIVAESQLVPAMTLKETPATVIETKEAVPVKAALFTVQKKQVTIQLASIEVNPKLDPISNQIEEKKLQFAAQDISIIQASLERPSIRKGRTMTIRAQWQKSSTKSIVENQALKIKLYEKNK